MSEPRWEHDVVRATNPLDLAKMLDRATSPEQRWEIVTCWGVQERLGDEYLTGLTVHYALLRRTVLAE